MTFQVIAKKLAILAVQCLATVTAESVTAFSELWADCIRYLNNIDKMEHFHVSNSIVGKSDMCNFELPYGRSVASNVSPRHLRSCFGMGESGTTPIQRGQSIKQAFAVTNIGNWPSSNVGDGSGPDPG
jgi:hypothetical protein